MDWSWSVHLLAKNDTCYDCHVTPIAVLPVEHVELELILGLLELLMLQCSMLLETFQNLKQLDSTGLFAGNLSEIPVSW